MHYVIGRELSEVSKRSTVLSSSLWIVRN